eukprot:SAG31_NODE_21378_length_551_cov_0.913717_1_plen_55_part_01
MRLLDDLLVRVMSQHRPGCNIFFVEKNFCCDKLYSQPLRCAMVHLQYSTMLWPRA